MENSEVNQKKILVFSPYYPPHVGGLESHAAEFNESIGKLGHDVLVFAPRIPLGTSEKESQGVVEVWRYPALEIISNYPIPKFWQKDFWNLLFSIKNKGTKFIVITRTRFFFSSFLGVLFAKINKWPLMHIEHGSDFVQTKNKYVKFIAHMYDMTVGHFVIHFASIVVANSQASALFVKKICESSNPTIIYRGIHAKKIISTIKTPLKENIPVGNVVLTFLGRLIDGKGVDILLKSISLNLDLSFTLLIVGNGPEKKNLQVMADSLSLGTRVIFLGEVSFERAMNILKNSDIFINPSLTEGMPTAVIEAAFCGVTIIATDVGGTREIAGEDAISFVKPNDILDLSHKIRELMKDENKRKIMGQKAYREVIDRFEWDVAANMYENIFNKL